MVSAFRFLSSFFSCLVIWLLRERSFGFDAKLVMAGSSMVADGSSPDSGRQAKKLKPNLLRVDPKPEKAESEKRRSLFYQFIESFHKEIGAEDCFCPIPPMLGDGKQVDLFKLYLVVREKGGYDAVSRNGLWDLVAEEAGLGSYITSAVKLVYAKYLVALERCLGRVVDVRSFRSEFGKKNSADLGGLSMDLGEELEGFLMEKKKNVVKEENPVIELDRNEKCGDGDRELMRADSCKRVLDFAKARKAHNDVHVKNEVVDWNEDKNGIDIDEIRSLNGSKIKEGKGDVKQGHSVHKNQLDGDDDVVLLDPALFKGSFLFRKRKRDPLCGMFDWITKLAKDPCCQAVGSLPEISEWERSSSEEPWKQVLLFREAAFLRRLGSNSEQIFWQKNQKMHPSIYDDQFGLAYNLRERLSSAKKVPSGRVASKEHRGLHSSSGTHREFESSMEESDRELNESNNPPGVSSFDHDDKKKVPIGPRFQANVPQWTDAVYECDLKWLGTQIWPLEKKERTFLLERDPIGRGRQDSCGCQVPGSIKCVQFHISEKRLKVKLELGTAFYHWKFDMMGEEAAASWKDAEKKTFKSIVESTAPPDCFWDQIYKKFPTKSREVLVSYYYNIFLLQRRAHQNRNAPNDIDSDDEESAWSLLADDFGDEAMNSKSILCTPKKKPHKKSK